MTDDLDMLADTLNELFERAEGVFAKLRVRATVPVRNGCELGFRKWTTSKTTREWRLVWLVPGKEPALLLSTSRETRVAAVQEIPNLHRALLGQQSVRVDEIRKAIEELETYLDGLEAEGNG